MLPENSVSGVPHIWSIDEIKALPEFGASRKAGWFYGLIEDTLEDGTQAPVLGEIFPGIGYAALGQDDLSEDWPVILRDLGLYSPERLAARAA